MPTTPNYGWNLPTVAGDLGAWGGILNTALTEVDTDLFAALTAKANLAGGNTFTGAQTFANDVTVSATLRVGLNSFLGAASGVAGAKSAQNILLYDAGPTNWAGVQADSDGNLNLNVGVATRRLFRFLTTGEALFPGAVSAVSFSGSGAGLTALPWAALTGVPSNVVNALTQTQGDVRYRQIGGAVPFADLTGVPSNVTNALTQTEADGIYRSLSIIVPWSDVAKPATVPWATRAGTRTRADIGPAGPNDVTWGSLDQAELIDALIVIINGLRFNMNALVDDLRAQNIIT